MRSSHRVVLPGRRIVGSVTTALSFSFVLGIAAPAVGQQGATGNQDTARAANPDSAKAAAEAAALAAAKRTACTQFKAYGKSVATESIKAAWKRGELFPKTTGPANQVQIQLPQIKLDPATMPDSIRTIAATAGTSCNAVPTPQTLVQLVQAQMNAPRPIIGVQFQPLTAKDTAGLGLPDLNGLLVQAVTAGSGAANAGIVKGDVIIALNGTAVTSGNQFLQQSIGWQDGQVVNVEVARQGGKREKKDITVKMSK